MKIIGYTLRRGGEAKYPVIGSGHCGPAQFVRNGMMSVRWDFVVRCAAKLDARGFLFNQTALQGFVLRVLSVNPAVSCEVAATVLGEAFLAKLGHDVPSCTPQSLSVTLSPTPFIASVTVDWADVPAGVDL